MTKQTTKQCPRCGNTKLVTFPSLDMKKCTDCGEVIQWHLDEGQAPLLGPSRSVKGVK